MVSRRSAAVAANGKQRTIKEVIGLIRLATLRSRYALVEGWRSFLMRRCVIIAIAAASIATSSANAQVDLSTYADAEGFLNVQALTCAQLANTWQEDADRLATWYSGWYNGLAKKHYMDIRKGKEVEHEVIVYCKAHPELRIIEAMDVVFKNMRQRMGIQVK
jgi:hypothetical protein